VVSTAVELLVAPALVAVATIVARRWGARAGGLISAFPAIVGPVLLIVALAHGARFAATAANGTLLGLVSLAAFALAYARAARRRGWGASLICGWVSATLAGLAVGLAGSRSGSPVGLAVAAASLGLAYRALPVAGQSPMAAARPWRATLPLRMATAALLVALLAAAAGALGALVGGMLAALPVLACVLAVFTHREAGGPAAIALLRGMLVGMAGFVIFCQLIATLIGGYGIAVAFVAATVAALAVQGATLYAPSVVHSLLRRHSSAARLGVAAAPGSWRRQSS
jgi:Protein of unknown function (DUF3147)